MTDIKEYLSYDEACGKCKSDCCSDCEILYTDVAYKETLYKTSLNEKSKKLSEGKELINVFLDALPDNARITFSISASQYRRYAQTTHYMKGLTKIKTVHEAFGVDEE